MTVIVTDGHLMACDGLIEDNQTIVSTIAKKIDRLSDGSLVGTAGDCLVGDLIVKWINTSPRKRGEYPGDGQTRALHLMPNGVLHLYCRECKGNPLPVDPPYAIGSGMDYALAALDMGGTVSQAVAVAIKRNAYCGGDIQIEAIV